MSGLTRYQALALFTAAATLALIAVGALVRTTDSGLGCPDWPLCHGRLLPPAQREAIIEYSHRSLASLVGVLIVAMAVTTFRVRRGDRVLLALAAASLPLLALQAWLGKVTVERELPAEVVTVHLATALLLLAVMALIGTFAVLGPARVRVQSEERGQLLRAAAVATLVTALVLLAGSYVVGAGASAACTDWPGCAEAPLPFADGGRAQSIHWLHRLSVLGGLAAVGAVAVAGASLREPAPWLRRAVWTLLALYVAQIAIGALNVWSDLAAAVGVAHLAAGSAIWALLVALAVCGRYRAVETPARAPAPAGRQPGRERSDARA